MLRGIPSRPGPRRMRRRYIHFTLCVIDKIIIIILYLFKWNHWKTYWRRRESWAPPISFAMSKNLVCRKNGLAKGYQNCVEIYLWKEIWIICKKGVHAVRSDQRSFRQHPAGAARPCRLVPRQHREPDPALPRLGPQNHVRHFPGRPDGPDSLQRQPAAHQQIFQRSEFYYTEPLNHF